MRKTILIIGIIIFLNCPLNPVLCPLTYANNISVSNGVRGMATDTVANTEKIQFDISWENSWRNATNYDAAWVFIKYSTDSGVTWNHATLKTAGTNPSGFARGTATVGGASKNLDIVVPTDKKGAFVQIASTDTGSGTLSATGIQFVWDYGTDGVTDAQASNPTETKIRIMTIEMVYIPTGSFDIGDGNATTESTNAFHVTDNTKLTIGTTLVGSIKVDVNTYDDTQIEGTGIGIDGDGGLDTDNNSTIDNANFPTGYNAFYIMKYEVSQGQYRDFLNMLTRTQQNTRTASQAASQFTMSNTIDMVWRSGIRNPASIPAGAITFGCDLNSDATFNGSADGEWVGCGYLAWIDVAAYVDWAALRPMTELEYEKAARGPTAAVNLEYAWGSTSFTQVTGITNGGANNETATNSGNFVYGSHASVPGPMRCGFAATSSTTRAQAGASYYGVMELSGNQWEEPVTVGNSTGRAFTGTHGDGSLSTNGNANNSDWPGYVTSEVTGASGSGFRGGTWSDAATRGRVSDRELGAYTLTTRYGSSGARCARTAP